MERRDFFKKATLTAAAALITKTGISNSMFNLASRKKILVGAHVWVYASKQPQYDVSSVLEQIFSDVAYAGFDGIELMEHPLRHSNYTKQIAELTEKYKIGLIGTSYGAQMWDKSKHSEIYEDVDLVITNLASVGGRTFGVSVGDPKGRLKTEKELDDQAELLKRLIALGNSKGVVLNFHNHISEVANDMHDFGGTLKRIPDLKLGPDLNWLQRAGVDPIAFLKKYGQNICFLHLRDQHSDGKWAESLGEGDMDFNEVGQTIKKINFKGDVIIELAFENDFTPTRPIKESLKMSRNYLRKTTGI